MKRYILPLLLICLLASGCSKSSEEEPPTSLELNSLLCPYFSNAETRSVSNEALDTLFIGNSYVPRKKTTAIYQAFVIISMARQLKKQIVTRLRAFILQI